MKKVLALLLAVLMLASVALAEEATMYDGDITFMGFSFGATLADVKEKIEENTKHDWRFDLGYSQNYAIFTRNLVDEMTFGVKNSWGGSEDNGNKYTVVQSIWSGDEYNVAGYGVKEFKMYFAYPNDGSQVIQDVDASVFYAGQYTFGRNNYPIGDEMFGDLEEKLTSVYGTPYSKGENVDAVFGDPDLTFWKTMYGDTLTVEEYNRIRYDDNGIRTNYVVWKSSTNDGVIVLEDFLIVGDKIRLTYLWMDGDKLLDEALNLKIEKVVPEQIGNGDTSGL